MEARYGIPLRMEHYACGTRGPEEDSKAVAVKVKGSSFGRIACIQHFRTARNTTCDQQTGNAIRSRQMKKSHVAFQLSVLNYSHILFGGYLLIRKVDSNYYMFHK